MKQNEILNSQLRADLAERRAAAVERENARLLDIVAHISHGRAPAQLAAAGRLTTIMPDGSQAPISAAEILSCPFCGSRPTGTFRGAVTAVNCSNDKCIAYCRQISIEQWQTRSSPVVAQPGQHAHSDEFFCPLCFDDPANIVSQEAHREAWFALETLISRVSVEAFKFAVAGEHLFDLYKQPIRTAAIKELRSMLKPSPVKQSAMALDSNGPLQVTTAMAEAFYSAVVILDNGVVQDLEKGMQALFAAAVPAKSYPFTEEMARAFYSGVKTQVKVGAYLEALERGVRAAVAATPFLGHMGKSTQRIPRDVVLACIDRAKQKYSYSSLVGALCSEIERELFDAQQNAAPLELLAEDAAYQVAINTAMPPMSAAGHSWWYFHLGWQAATDREHG